MNEGFKFPTLRRESAAIVSEYFSQKSVLDPVPLVNSFVSGLSIPQSALDFTLLIDPATQLER